MIYFNNYKHNMNRVLILIYVLMWTTNTLPSYPLKGDILLGYYYVDVLVGNPPQKMSLIVDTGSN